MNLNNKGFISMTSILAIIVTISVLLILNIDIKMQNNNLLNKIKTDARENIQKATEPICEWSPEIYMVKTSTNPAYNAITLTCKHVNNLNFNSTINMDTFDKTCFNIIDENSSSTNNIDIKSVSTYESSGGFTIILELNGNNISYNNKIILNKNIFCMNDNDKNICNKEIVSNPIHVVEKN